MYRCIHAQYMYIWYLLAVDDSCTHEGRLRPRELWFSIYSCTCTTPQLHESNTHCAAIATLPINHTHTASWGNSQAYNMYLHWGMYVLTCTCKLSQWDKAKQSNYSQRQLLFCLPQAEFEPTMFCVLGRHSTNWATEVAQPGRPNLWSLCKTKGVSPLINRVTVYMY